MGASPLMSVGMPAAAPFLQLRMRCRAPRVFCNYFDGKGEFALLPAGPSARVAASCTASDSNQNSYAQRRLQKRSLVRRYSRPKRRVRLSRGRRPVRSSCFSTAVKAAPERSGGAWTKYRLSSVNGSLHNPRRAPRPVLLARIAGRRRHRRGAQRTRPSKPTRRLLPNTGRTT